LINKQNK